MPDRNGVAFPSRVVIPDKLDQLEEERNYLLRMCPKDKHKDYEEGRRQHWLGSSSTPYPLNMTMLYKTSGI